jgi:hypothetical protein
MTRGRKPEFLKSRRKAGPPESRSRADDIPPDLKMAEREDWTLFRTVDGLMQKAGVPAKYLRRLVLKELGDNALDTGAAIRFRRIDGSPDRYFVEDDGPGFDLTPEQIAELYSIRRPMRSSKLLRLPQRGALGNGLRIVAGAVLAAEGSLVVTTRDLRIVLQPQADGSTAVANVTVIDHPLGVRVEVGFGPALPRDPDALMWIRRADRAARTGKSYDGRSSPFWYDAPQFHELLLAYGRVPVRNLIAQLDGCTGGKAGEIVNAAGLERMVCAEVNRQQAACLLQTAREQARPVSPDRLGGVGRNGYPDAFYAVERGTVELGTAKPLAEIPFVIEVWAKKLTSVEVEFDDELVVILTINRTPAVDEVTAWRDGDKDLRFSGSGLDRHYGSDAPKKGAYIIVINATTPHCPVTSDGKAPDLAVFADQIFSAAETAMRKAQRAAPKDQSDRNDQLLPRKSDREQVRRFCALIVSLRSGMDFEVGARGWCYILERHGLAKGSFKAAERLITSLRKSGDLPLDICAEDASRETVGLEVITPQTVEQYAEKIFADLRDHAHEQYTPFNFWNDLDVYVEVAVEKLDLRNLFEPVCAKLHVPITNLKGWSDLNARAAMMRRFKAHEAAGRRCVLLLCGDHDPGGLQITERMLSNLKDLSKQIGWRPDNLKIERFGLNADFINEHRLTWIDNLETSSGGHLDDPAHPDHNKRYVQDYIAEFGVRKCEANALVVEPEIGRQLCRAAILQYVPADAIERYERKLDAVRKRLRRALRQRLSGAS